MPRNRTATRSTPAEPVDEAPEVEELDDSDEAEVEGGIRPKDLAAELEVSPKTLRAFLRRQFPRAAQEKNTSWLLSDEIADEVRDHFTATEPEEEEVEDENAVTAEA